ncbi:MAG: methyltransferase domain-containing protein [Neobacillus sp.]|jgi:ubiquinone/menaquinone biosynthesis C-methylase UbiE
MDKINYGQVANSYARSREDIPANLIDSLYIRGIFLDGKKVADIGCGTGVLTRKLAIRKAELVGVDLSKEMLEEAKNLNIIKNFQIPYHVGASDHTGLPENTYDMVTAMRAWHWFDREKTLEEIKRILKARGTLIVIDSGFLKDSDVVKKTIGVVSELFDGGLSPSGTKAKSKQMINGFPVEWFEEWSSSGFELRDFYKLNYSVSFTKETWIERIESVSWLARLEPEARKNVLRTLEEKLTEQEPYNIPHECNVCILRLRE